MGLSLVGTATAAATTVTAPAHQKGDVLEYAAYRSGSTTAPTLPTTAPGLRNAVSKSGTTCSMRVATKVATGIGSISSSSQNTSTGIWTTATNGLVAGQVVQVTGSLPGGFSANTNYFVLPTSLTSTTVMLATTQGGSVKKPTSSVATTIDTDPCGTWTNATQMVCHVYRPSSGNVTRIGQTNSSSSTTLTVNFPALSPMADSWSGNPFVTAFVGVNNTSQTITTAPAGLTNQSSLTGSTTQIAGFDSNGGVSSWSSVNATNTGTAGDSVTCVVEIVLATTSSGAYGTNIRQFAGGNGLQAGKGLLGNGYKVPVPEGYGNGNSFLLFITYDGGATVSSVSGTNCGSLGSAVASALAGSGNLDSAAYLLQGITAGTADDTITVTFASTVGSFGYNWVELYGVKTSGGNSGTQSTALNTTPAAGSFTPTNNDSTGGNLIVAYHAKADVSPGQTTSRIFSGANFTLVVANANWNEIDGLCSCVQAYVQTTHAAINPSIQVPGTTSDNWNSIVVCVPIASGSGTGAPSSGAFVAGVQHGTCAYPTSGTVPFQWPSFGTTRMAACTDGSLHTQIIQDNEGNTWPSDGTANPGGTGIFYLPSASANPNLEVTISGGGTDANVSWRGLSVNGLTSSPLQGSIFVADATTGTTYTPSSQPVTTAAAYFILAHIGLGQGPGRSVTAPSGAIWGLCTYTNETDIDTIENADIMSYYKGTTIGTITHTFTCDNNTSSTGGFTWFNVAAGSVGIAARGATQAFQAFLAR